MPASGESADDRPPRQLASLARWEGKRLAALALEGEGIDSTKKQRRSVGDEKKVFVSKPACPRSRERAEDEATEADCSLLHVEASLPSVRIKQGPMSLTMCSRRAKPSARAGRFGADEAGSKALSAKSVPLEHQQRQHSIQYARSLRIRDESREQRRRRGGARRGESE